MIQAIGAAIMAGALQFLSASASGHPTADLAITAMDTISGGMAAISAVGFTAAASMVVEDSTAEAAIIAKTAFRIGLNFSCVLVQIEMI